MSHILCDYINKTRFELKRGVVVGFPRFEEAALRSMKEDLGLSMTISELRFCQRAYDTPEHSAPTLDEIYFLDAIANGHHHSRDFASVARLRLYHPEAVRTYRDLLEKRTLLAGKPCSDAPSLYELSELLTQVLARSGRQIGFTHGVRAIADPSEALSATATGLNALESLSVDASLPSLRLFSDSSDFLPSTAKAEEDDAILLLRCPTEERVDTEEDSIDSALILRVSLFAKSPIYRNNVHAYRAVDNRGIVAALVSLCDGIYAELSEIPSVFDDGELYDLALSEHGSLLVAVPRCIVNRFSEEANKYGIFASQIARAVKGNRLTVRRQGHAPYSFLASFLRAFSELRIPFFLEGQSESQSITELFHSAFRNRGASGVSESDRIPTSVVSSSLGLCSAAGSQTLSFESGLNTALLSVFEAVLSGAELSNISIYDLYAYPEKLTSTSMGSLFEAFLGVYRVLAELALPNRTSLLPHSEQGLGTKGVAVYCFSKSGQMRAEHFLAHGSRVYLISLLKNEDGFYDFEGIRSLLRLLSELQKNRQIRSAAIGVNQAPSEIIEKMCSACTVQYDAFVSESELAVPFKGIFIVLEAASEIKALKHIGVVWKIISNETVIPPTIDIPVAKAPVVSQKRIPIPTVVLLPALDSGNLHALTELFEANGCMVRILPDLTTSAEVLADAQIAVFCRRSMNGISEMILRIRKDLRAGYALRSLIERDGILLAPEAVRESISELLGTAIPIEKLDSFSGTGIYLYDGLSQDAVQKVVDFYR